MNIEKILEVKTRNISNFLIKRNKVFIIYKKILNFKILKEIELSKPSNFKGMLVMFTFWSVIMMILFYTFYFTNKA